MTFHPIGICRRDHDGRHRRNGADLPGAADQAGGVVPAGRRRRRRGPSHRPAAVGASRAAGRDREPSRRQRQYRRRDRRQCRARRLHAAGGPERAVRHQPASLFPDAVRPAQGPAADRQRAGEYPAAHRQSDAGVDQGFPRLHRRWRARPSRRCSTRRSATAASITWRWRCSSAAPGSTSSMCPTRAAVRRRSASWRATWRRCSAAARWRRWCSRASCAGLRPAGRADRRCCRSCRRSPNSIRATRCRSGRDCSPRRERRPAIVEQLRTEIRAILTGPEYGAKLAAAGSGEPLITTPEEFAARIRSDHEAYGKVIREIGAKIN